MTDALQPTFPPELEELIFTSALCRDFKDARNLCLVAKRVHGWIVPQVYKVVIFNAHRPDEVHAPHEKVTLDDLVRYGKHVRHLSLRNNEPHFEDKLAICVSRCPNIRSLALWTPQDPIPFALAETLFHTSVNYLSLDMGAFTSALNKGGWKSTISLPSVTHLQLVESVQLNPGQIKDHFPSVTHIAISDMGHTHISIVKDLLNILGTQLKLVTWYLWKYWVDYQPVAVRTLDYIDVDDPRVVVLWYGSNVVQTWLEGVEGGFGIWRVAEEAMNARYAAAASLAE